MLFTFKLLWRITMSIMLKYVYIILLVSSAFIFDTTQTKAQNPGFYYTYDLSGNRIGRAYTSVFIKKGDTTQITAKTGEFFVKVLPNPAKEYFQVQINGLTSDNITKIEIHNIKGECLFLQENMRDALQIPIKEWMVGTYFLTVTIDGKPIYWKMIKED